MAVTSRRQFSKALREANPKLPQRDIDAMYDDYDRGTRRLVLRLYRNRTDDELLEAAAAHFATLDRPALVVWGAADPFVPVHHAEQQRPGVPARGGRRLGGQLALAVPRRPRGRRGGRRAVPARAG